jgi:hypothetical protein
MERLTANSAEGGGEGSQLAAEGKNLFQAATARIVDSKKQCKHSVANSECNEWRYRYN